MGRENKKEIIAALHKEQILKAAETLFYEKGYVQTTIEDISKAAEYSRRTIYAYYESKEDILHHIIEKGLQTLKEDIEGAVNRDVDFVEKYQSICTAMTNYQRKYPHSVESVNRVDSTGLACEDVADTVKNILLLGTEINEILASFIENGKENGIVRKDVVPMLSVYVLWSGITSLVTLADKKEKFICSQFSLSENEFLDYGFKQLINSILEVRI